ncbi:YciI family protein [Undibacterium sp. TJN25]|uniref:YciI family protein n=1 Tax=Undibacterium sp. TJN25 TaxID=3413056 RepID=UPI003BF0A5F6
MIYIFHLLDKPDSLALRTELRPRHKAYLAEVVDRIAFAGPLMSEDGNSMLGSLLAIDFASREEALRWQADEPFTKGGVYGSVSVLPFVNLWPQKAGFPQD